MRATPAQLAVRQICGQPVWRECSRSVEERLQSGHEFLVDLTGVDFGYDLQAWHDHLKESRDGGYTYARNNPLPRIMQDALQSEEWQAAVARLTKRCS